MSSWFNFHSNATRMARAKRFQAALMRKNHIKTIWYSFGQFHFIVALRNGMSVTRSYTPTPASLERLKRQLK